MQAEDAPRGEVMDRIHARLLSSLAPVRPLPSDRGLIAGSVAVFGLAAILETLPFGFAGLRALSGMQRLILYPVLAVASIFLAVSVAGQMIPGSKRRLPPVMAIAFPVVSVGLVAVILFHEFSLNAFVKLGRPCLILGTVCALPAALLVWLLLRRGLVVSPVAAGAATGVFAGLTGLTVLALHCPILNSMHVLVWHLGVIVLGGLAGAACGRLATAR